jgi:hypothetical protein
MSSGLPTQRTIDPSSEQWLPYYAAAERLANERIAMRERRVQSVRFSSQLLWAIAAVGAAALYVFLRSN